MVKGFTEARAQALARLILTRTLGVSPGESVTIETWTDTLPWGNAFVRQAHKIRARPLLLHRDDATYWNSVEENGQRSVFASSPAEWSILEKSDAYVGFLGPSDVRREFELRRSVPKEADEEMHRWHSIANRIGLRIAWLYLGRVHPAVAAGFGLGADRWREELIAASLVDPTGMHTAGARLAARLQKGKEVAIDHRNGTHLKLRLRGRRPVVYGGLLAAPRSSRNPSASYAPAHLETPMPAGFVSVALDEGFAEGSLVSNQAGELTGWSLERSSGGDWTFVDGHLTRARFATGQEEFDAAFAKGGVGRDQPAILSIGLNPEIHRAPWMVDQGLGIVAVGIGGNRHLGGSSASPLHCNLHVARSELRIDGRLAVKAGAIV